MPPGKKIYVAGAQLKRARRVIATLRRAGYAITYDWPKDLLSWDCVCNTSPEGIARLEEEQGISDWTCVCKGDQEAIAVAERDAVRAADSLVFLWRKGHGLESACYEVGMAMGRGIPVLVVGRHDDFFYLLPEVHKIADDEGIVSSLQSL